VTNISIQRYKHNEKRYFITKKNTIHTSSVDNIYSKKYPKLNYRKVLYRIADKPDQKEAMN